MVQRIITSGIGLIVFFAVFFANEVVFSAAVAVLIITAIYEMHKAMSTGKTVFIISLASAGLLLGGIYTNNVQTAVVISMVAYMISSVFLHTKRSFKDIYSGAFTTYFVTFFFSALIKLRCDFGPEAVFLVFLFAWITDTGAYFSGRFFGKHKLIPKVSPKKTVEGAVGGVISTVICTCAYLAILKNGFGIENIGGAGYGGISILAVVASVLSQLGDLAASAIKRDCGVKDFGTILPGHGGIMDRFDSVIFIAPLVLWFLTCF